MPSLLKKIINIIIIIIIMFLLTNIIYENVKYYISSNFLSYTYDFVNIIRKYNYYLGSLMAKYLSYNFMDGDWWNNIGSNIILGAIPLHNSNHLELLKKENVGAVLSLVEDFEMNGVLYFKPISKEDWERNNIHHLQIQVEDSGGLRVDDFKKCMEYISKNIRENRKVYIHCKAGRGRSASVVLCYLLWNIYNDKGNITEQDISVTYDYLKKLRNEVSINDDQFITIKEFVKQFMKKTKNN